MIVIARIKTNKNYKAKCEKLKLYRVGYFFFIYLKSEQRGEIQAKQNKRMSTVVPNQYIFRGTKQKKRKRFKTFFRKSLSFECIFGKSICLI